MDKKQDIYKKIHANHRERVKEKFLTLGFDGMHSHEILEILLYYSIPQKDTNPIAHELIEKFDSLSGVFDADYNELLKTYGIKEHSAVLIKLIPEICKKYQQDKLRQFTDCKNHTSTVDYLKSYLTLLNHEEFHVLCLTSDLKLLKHLKLFSGTVNSAHINLRVLTEEVLKYDTAGIIIAHNHPSKNSQPSIDDDLITEKILHSLNYLNIQLLDHIIIAGEKAYSYHANLRLDEIKSKFSVNFGSVVADKAEKFDDLYRE
ncbi:MAG: DNA repair protein RadC [Firmicutes bacterium]|nr:DNA repair protein RadC [Bacillota bacterium]